MKCATEMAAEEEKKMFAIELYKQGIKFQTS